MWPIKPQWAQRGWSFWLAEELMRKGLELSMVTMGETRRMLQQNKNGARGRRQSFKEKKRTIGTKRLLLIPYQWISELNKMIQ